MGGRKAYRTAADRAAAEENLNQRRMGMFQGRYGNDHLNRALAFFAIGVSAITLFLPHESWVRRILAGIST